MSSMTPPVYGGEGKRRKRRKYHLIPTTRFTAGASDSIFFVFAGVAATVLTALIFQQGFQNSWLNIGLLFLFWVVTAYLTLPRLHSIFTRIYVPDYFIGRTRTADGLLGDPINLSFQATEEQIHHAMTEAGWSRADDVTLKSSWGIVRSTLSRKSYPEAPVSPLLLFGRVQAFAYQLEVDGNPGKRHHVRFWKSPDGWVLPGGQRVDWVAAATYDTGVGFSFFTLQITHRIDPETDFERDFILESLQYHVPSTDVEIIKDFSTGYHSRNGGGDNIVTDGNLPIVVLNNVPPHRSIRDDRIDLHSASDIARKMPMNVLVGTALVLLWSLVQSGQLLYRLRNPIDLQQIVTLEPSVQRVVDFFGVFEFLDLIETSIPVLIICFIIVQLIVAWRLLKRSSRARLLMLDLLAFAFLIHLVRTFVWGQHLELATIVGQMSILVFAMLAYTSDQARQFTEKAHTLKTPWLAKPDMES